ncbi:MAG: stage II sporulation protein M [Desulfurococcales archaeon]|nr:stage II sporulation protein M [Desulfurococcales archaeon]
MDEELWRYVSNRLVRYWVYMILLISITMTLSTLFYPVLASTRVGDVVERQIEELFEKAESVSGPDPVGLAALIFLNNTMILLLMALLSPTIVAPILIGMYQGLVVGYIIPALLEGGFINSQVGYGPVVIYYGLSVHGVIEIPAIALALSPLLGVFRQGLRRTITYVFKLVPYSVLLLVIAAVIESVVTRVMIILIVLIKILFGL